MSNRESPRLAQLIQLTLTVSVSRDSHVKAGYLGSRFSSADKGPIQKTLTKPQDSDKPLGKTDLSRVFIHQNHNKVVNL